MSCKALGIALKLTFEGDNQLVYPQTYIFLVVVAGAVVTQVRTQRQQRGAGRCRALISRGLVRGGAGLPWGRMHPSGWRPLHALS